MMKNKQIMTISALVWAALFFSTLSLSVGSFGEMEPKAGLVFGIMAGLILVTGSVMGFIFFNKNKGKNQSV